MIHRRLFWRVYLHGLLLLALVTAALALATVMLGRPNPFGLRERLRAELAARSAELVGDSHVLSRDLERDYLWFGLEISVYGTDGSLLATNVHPPLPRTEEDGFPVAGSGQRIGRAVLHHRRLTPQVRHVLHVSGLILAFLALGSIPMARQITSPLERLTRTVERFGEGDLSARTGIVRRDEVGDLARAFDTMAERLARLVRAEKEFLANVSHELRTPLARVRVALEIAAEGDEAKARAYLGEIASDLDELERLVEDVLTAARLDLSRGRVGAAVPGLRREPVSAEELVRQAGARFRAAHPARRLELSLQDGLPLLSADPVLLRRALDNLLDNAARYSDGDRPVELAAHVGGAGLVVSVRDEGMGMDAADHAQLFTPFFRADRSRARHTGGVGLGLALARGIVEAHGGTIEVDSRLGVGTTFHVRLPAAG